MRATLLQLLCAVAGLGLGLLLPRVTFYVSVASTRVTETLVAVGFGVLGLASLIFTLLFLVAQWAFGSLSPRLTLFRDDPIVWRTFGLVIGLWVFSVTAALAIGNDPKVSIIVPVAAVVTVLVTLALIRTLVVKAFASIQLAPALSAIAARGRATIDDLYRRPGTGDKPPAPPLPPLTRTVTWPHPQAILQQLNLRRLSAASGTAVVVLRASIGDTLQEGAPVADLHGADMTDAAVLRMLVTGPERTFGQDPMFAFRLLADIGLRALSPAVNDPATAVQVLDTTESLLLLLATRDLDVAGIADDHGTVRAVLVLPSWNDYLRVALDDLIESSARSPMVLLRARAMLSRCAAPPRRSARHRSSGAFGGSKNSPPGTSRCSGAIRPTRTRSETLAWRHRPARTVRHRPHPADALTGSARVSSGIIDPWHVLT